MAYVAVTVEGGLFPPDLLDRIASGQAEAQRPDDFGLPAGRRLIDETQSAFSDVHRSWVAFQSQLPYSRQSPTTLTRSRWMEPFLERLGFDLATHRSTQVGGESYAFSHRAGDDPEALPVHIVALGQSLDSRYEGSRRSPHALVQEYLNRSDALWGVVTNGERLRLLRDSARLSRPTYLEFDLRAMLEANLYNEFVLLYRLLHRSRFPRGSADAHECLLERYYQQGIDEGGRVRERLREGVEAALQELGTALLVHPDSDALREKVRAGRLDAQDYYRQLLRLIYRFLFLLVVEERRLIFPPEAEHADRQPIYTQYYSLGRLRDRCERHFADDRFSDLWQGLLQSFYLFRDADAARRIGLSALDGELFGPDACADLEGAGCENGRLLLAIYHLSTFQDGRVRRRINYAGLDVEELGSVYESLLDYHPHVTLGGTPRFELVAGSERKQTGSYYTPPELVRELIESALVPVMEERLAAARTTEEKQQALLALRVCDPASGSGHFLLAAARRIGRELARVRTGEAEPPPEKQREAARDVIRTCIYAVDKNPLAVDLCKVALWIEGHNAGLPLSFLDHHVKCGDSLVGVADLKVLEESIPDEAFNRSDPRQRATARALRNINRRERDLDRTGHVQAHLAAPGDGLADHLLNLAIIHEELERTPDDTPLRVAEKAHRYEVSRAADSDWWVDTTACHLWTATFFLDLSSGSTHTPTTGTLRRFLMQPRTVDGHLIGRVWDIAVDRAHPFFHWPLEFPDVFMDGGFDVILSNPPFLGGTKISTTFGDNYRQYVASTYTPAGGTTDVCAYFFRRAYELLRPSGHLGMVASNTIGQGDTRQGGLAVIVQLGGTIAFARRFIKWPGVANVEVNLVTLCKGAWLHRYELDNNLVPFISSRLDSEPEAEPVRLRQNEREAFQGSKIDGMGFVLVPEETQLLIERDPRNCQCLFPFLNGEDLNSRPDQSPSRWVINFFDWPLSRAETYPELISIVREKVKPEREMIRRERNRTRWWLYAENRPGLYSTIARQQRVLVRTIHSEYHMTALVPNGMVYSHALEVFAFEDYYYLALLQSNVHEAWVSRQASSLESRTRYTATDCFDSFPFPQHPLPEHHALAERCGEQYHEQRRQVMLERQLGLTKTYSLFHNPACEDGDVCRLRELHAEMGRAILACYGWQDLDPAHAFYQNARGQTRFTVSPEARREIVRRLLELNLRIAAEEAAERQGLRLRAT